MRDRPIVKRLILIAGVAAALAACEAWGEAWEALFTRTDLGERAEGWTGGDVALSTPLPRGRVLYLFGDSFITSMSQDRTRPELDGDGWARLAHTVFGNTIAVQSVAAPEGATMTYLAREGGAVRDVTLLPKSEPRPLLTQFFDHARLGLAAQEGRYFWPIGAECIDCEGPSARLLLAFTEWEYCTVEEDGAACIPLCDLTSPNDKPCTSGVMITGNVMAKFQQLELEPSAWTLDGSAIRLARTSTDVQWGNAFVREGTTLYVYGSRPRELASEVVVRKTTVENLTWSRSSEWVLWRTVNDRGAWSTTASAPLRPVATAPAYFSVDKVALRGLERYVLTYVGLDNRLTVRVSTSLNSASEATTFPSQGPTTPRIDLYSIDPTVRTQVEERIAAGCVPRETTPVVRRELCGVSYHGLLQPHLSTAQRDTLRIPATYIVPYGPNPFFDVNEPEDPDENPRTGQQDGDYYRPRFTYVQLDKLRPFCTVDCWEGVVFNYALPAPGAVYDFDIRQVTGTRRFYAELTREETASSGLVIDYRSGATLLRSDVCMEGNPVICNAEPPTGAALATVRVTGPAFNLRVHHAHD